MTFDQHFMIDEDLLQKIASHALKKKYIIEIGCGKGALTRYLLEHAKVIGIEIDEICCDILQEKFKKQINNEDLEIINKNILDFNFNKIKETTKTVFSNLPYSISEPFFYKIIKSPIQELYLVTGKQFLELLQNEETKLGIYTKELFNLTKIQDVSRTAFTPQPRVESAFFSLIKKNEQDIISEFLKQYDKKVKNALIESIIRIKEKTKREAKERLEQLNISEEILQKRIMHLSNHQFKELYETLKQNFK